MIRFVVITVNECQRPLSRVTAKVSRTAGEEPAARPPRPRDMSTRQVCVSPGHRAARTSHVAHVARLCLAVALLLPLLAACGSDDVTVTPGAGPETPAPAPSATPAYCGLKPEGQAERTQDGMTFPATGDYLGKPLDQVRTLAEGRKLTVRVVGEDGTCGAITDDLSTTRVNVYVENGVVKAVGAF